MSVFEINDNAIFSKNDVFGLHAGKYCQLAVGNQVANLPVDRHDVLRLNNVVAVDQFSRGRVAGNVNLSVRLVNNLCTQTREVVNDAVHRILITRNQGRRENHRIAGFNTDKAMRSLRDSRKGGHWLSLRPRCHVYPLIRGKQGNLIGINNEPLGNCEIALFLSDTHIPFHRTANQGDAATMMCSSVDDLLDAVNMRSKRSNNDLAGSLSKNLI